MHYWLMKSEPDVFSIQDLKRKKRSGWDGVRNYQARNFMREMQKGDLAFFYHSSCEIPGVMGVMRVSQVAHPDPTQFEKKSEYFDPKATQENPIWQMVEVEFVDEFSAPVTLEDLRGLPALKEMIILRRGNRLSITPVTEKEWKTIQSLRKP